MSLTTPPPRQSEWESEGYDRTSMSLPGHQDALITAVAAANPRTVVVLQSGTPVSMPWASSVPSILQSWFGGNETGSAIASVLFGSANPAGKLPLTFPVRNEDNPAFLNFKSDKGRALYGEDVFVGYRYYEKAKREVLFPFGHGLSYTSFALSDLSVHLDAPNDSVSVSVEVRNTGDRTGAEVVQVYVAPKAPSVTRPVKELKGFEKVVLERGERRTVEIELRVRDAISFWDEQRDAWCAEKGEYEVVVGNSSEGGLREGFVVGETVFWRGL